MQHIGIKNRNKIPSLTSQLIQKRIKCACINHPTQKTLSLYLHGFIFPFLHFYSTKIIYPTSITPTKLAAFQLKT